MGCKVTRDEKESLIVKTHIHLLYRRYKGMRVLCVIRAFFPMLYNSETQEVVVMGDTVYTHIQHHLGCKKSLR